MVFTRIDPYPYVITDALGDMYNRSHNATVAY
jgi:hypothetical protein